MSKITELRKYKESKEFQDILSKCKNRQEAKQTKVLALYENGKAEERTDCVYNNHDVNAQRMILTKAILEEINSNSEWATILRDELQKEIDRTAEFLTLGIRDQYGITNSSQIFDSIDLLRCEIQDNRYFQTQLDGMIAALEKEEEQKPSLTENDAED